MQDVAPAIRICRGLLEEGAQLAIFDPKVSAQQIAAYLGQEAQAHSTGAGMQGEGVWQPATDPLAAAQGADAVVLLTEWEQFRQLDWPGLAAGLRVWVAGAQGRTHRRRLAKKPAKPRMPAQQYRRTLDGSALVRARYGDVRR